MRLGVAGAVGWTVAVAALVGCTGDGGSGAPPGPTTAPPTSGSTVSGPTSPAPPTTGPTGGSDGTELTQPLVIATNVHRPRLELTLAEARSLAAGRAASLPPSVGRVRLSTRPDALADVRAHRWAVAVVPASAIGPTVRAATVDGVDPLRRPGAYPLTTTSGRVQPVVTTVTFVGDIMLGRGVEAANPAGAGQALGPYAPRLRASDLTVANLESTLSRDGRPRQGDDSFAARPTVVPALASAGIDLVTLANNHVGDFGPRALTKTLARLDRSPVAHVGAGRDAAEAWAPVVVRRNGLAFGFLAFNAIGETPRATATSPGAAQVRMQPRLGPLNRHDLARMTSAVRRLAARVDVVTVLPHWGTQYTHRAVPDQQRVGRALVDAGADLVIGSHPHWVQGLEARRGAVIAYSLGNFVFDMDFMRQTMEGMALDVTLWDDRVVAVTPAPVELDSRFAPHAADGARGQRVVRDVWRSSFGVFGSLSSPIRRPVLPPTP